MINPGTASEGAVQEFISHAGPVLAVVDDAQSIDSSTIRGFERAVSEDHAAILCVTSWGSAAERVTVASQQAVNALAEFCSSNSEGLIPALARLDDRIGHGPFYEPIEHRIELARQAEFPWQFMQTLSGGDRRLREEPSELQSSGHATLLGLIAIRQITSLDEGASQSELESLADSIGVGSDQCQAGLEELRHRRLLIERDGRIRLPHIRFAISALKEMFRQPTDDPAPDLLQIARKILLNDETTDRGRFWLVDGVRTESLRRTHALVDTEVRDYLARNLFNADENNRGLRALLLWTAQWGHNPLPDSTWLQISAEMPAWIHEATDGSAYGLHWLLNGLRGQRKELHQDVCIRTGLNRLINRMIEVGTGADISAWDELISEVCQVNWETAEAWSNSINDEVDLSHFSDWVLREVERSEFIDGWAALAQSLWNISPEMVEVTVHAIEPRLIGLLETSPTRAHSVIFPWYLGFLALTIQPDEDDDDPYSDVRARYRRLMLDWIEATDWHKVGVSLSRNHPSDLHNFSLLAYALSKIDQDKLDQMCHAVTVDAFDALPTTYWQSGVWGDYDFIAVLSASRDMQPARSLLDRHRDEISDLAPWAIAVVPDIAVSLPSAKVHLRYGSHSFHWQECAQALEAVTAVDRESAIEIINTNLDALLQEMLRADPYSAEAFPRFVAALDSVDPALLTGLIADLDSDTAAPNWLKRLKDADAGATIVRAVLERLGVTEHDYVTKHSGSKAAE